ncbi:MAG: LCP family protein, partial [Actinobacteria bacterium]|nr:LCP family protein [Actinomycetota bacterium]
MSSGVADLPTGRGRHGSQHGRGWRHSAWRVVAFIATVLSVLAFAGFGYGWYEYRSLNHGLQRFHLSNLAGGAAAPKVSKAKGVNGTAMNILVTGLDSRTGLSQGERDLLGVGNDDSLSTDTVMVIHVPADGSKATLISLPRDSYVDVPGYLKNKLNAAYADGYTYASGTTKQQQAAGANLLIQTVTQLTGLRIDHYIQVGFGGFYNIAKVVGNISVNLCHATNDTGAYDLAHGEGAVGSGFVMSAGEHELNPVQALEFVRQR